MGSPGGADVDNFAKLLNDAIKGPAGLLFDDCQIQRLEIAWLPSDEGRYFELVINSNPDNHITRPATLYEMADRLWYPFSDIAMENNCVAIPLLSRLDYMARLKTRLRHHLRQGGMQRQAAFKAAIAVQTVACGFHYSRINENGFVLKRYSEWAEGLGDRESDQVDPEYEARLLASAILASRKAF